MTVNCYLSMRGKKRWKDLLVLAIDGSTSHLPSSKDIESHFGVYATNKYGLKCYKARMLMVYDVLNRFVLSACLSKLCFGESRLMIDCIGKWSGKLRSHVYVMDRNFDSFGLLKQVLTTDPHAHLCVRLSSRSHFYDQVLAHPAEDFITTWTPSKDECKNCKSKQIDTEPLTVRVTKVMLKTGEVELLVSTLTDQRTYSQEDLATLYSLRWGVEEGFKNLKPKMKLEHYGCKKTKGVYQEFYAHIFMMNLVSLHGMLAAAKVEAKTHQRAYAYTYNWKNAYRFMRASIVELFSKEAWIATCLEQLIERFQRSIIPIKPGRSFVRDMRSNNVKTRITHYNK